MIYWISSCNWANCGTSTNTKFTFRGEYLSFLWYNLSFFYRFFSYHITSLLSQEGNSSVDSFEQFYSFHDDEFKKRVKVISMKEFIEREQNKLLTLNDEDYKRVLALSSSCQNRRKSEWMKKLQCK